MGLRVEVRLQFTMVRTCWSLVVSGCVKALRCVWGVFIYTNSLQGGSAGTLNYFSCIQGTIRQSRSQHTTRRSIHQYNAMRYPSTPRLKKLSFTVSEAQTCVWCVHQSGWFKCKSLHSEAITKYCQEAIISTWWMGECWHVFKSPLPQQTSEDLGKVKWLLMLCFSGLSSELQSPERAGPDQTSEVCWSPTVQRRSEEVWVCFYFDSWKQTHCDITQSHLWCHHHTDDTLITASVLCLFLCQCQWMLKVLEDLQRTEEHLPFRLKVKLLLSLVCMEALRDKA